MNLTPLESFWVGTVFGLVLYQLKVWAKRLRQSPCEIHLINVETGEIEAHKFHLHPHVSSAIADAFDTKQEYEEAFGDLPLTRYGLRD